MDYLIILMWLAVVYCLHYLVKRLVLWSVVQKVRRRPEIDLFDVQDISIGVSGVRLYNLKLGALLKGHFLFAEAESINLSSCFIGKKLGLSTQLKGAYLDLKLSQPLLPSSEDLTTGDRRDDGLPSQIGTSVFQWLAAVSVEDSAFVVSGYPLPPCSQLHGKFERLSLQATQSSNADDALMPLHFTLSELSTQLKSTENPLELSPPRVDFLANLALSVRLTSYINILTSQPEGLDVYVQEPQVSVHQDLLPFISKTVQKFDSNNSTLPHQTSGHQSHNLTLDKTKVNISELSARLKSHQDHRTIKVELKFLQLDGRKSEHLQAQQYQHTFSLKALQGECGGKSFLSLHELHITSPVKEPLVLSRNNPFYQELSSQPSFFLPYQYSVPVTESDRVFTPEWNVTASLLHIEYLQSHINYWSDEILQYRWGVTSEHVPTTPNDVSTETTEKPHPNVPAELVAYRIKLSSIQISSVLLDHVGFISGFDQLDIYAKSNRVLDVQLARLYSTTKKCSQVPAEIHKSNHAWDTILFCDNVSSKTEKKPDRQAFAVTTELHSLRAEWSVDLVKYILETVESIMPYYKRYRAHKLPPDKLQDDERLRVDSTPKITLEDCRLTIHNTTLFASNKQKVCLMTRIDHVRFTISESYLFRLYITEYKLHYLHHTNKPLQLEQVDGDLVTVAHIVQLSSTLDRTNKAVLVSTNRSGVFKCTWTKEIHMCIWLAFQDGLRLKNHLRPYISLPKTGDSQSSPLDQYMIQVKAEIDFTAILTTEHRFAILGENLILTQHNGSTVLESNVITLMFDDQPVFTFQEAVISLNDSNQKFQTARDSFVELHQKSNNCLTYEIGNLTIKFPHKFNFDSCFTEIINTIRWLKLVMEIERNPFTLASPLPRDIRISVPTVTLIILDDSFEVKLGDNYALMVDESREAVKRGAAMESKIKELESQHKVLQPDQRDKLFESLNSKNSEIYLRRSHELYKLNGASERALFKVELCSVEIFALADPSLHGTENVVELMKFIDKQSPMPEKIFFSTLWARVVSVAAERVTFSLRDYPLPLVNVTNAKLWGNLIGAEACGAPRAIREVLVKLEQPWDNCIVERNMCPLKFYHDISWDTGQLEFTHGACWENTLAQVNQALDLVNKPSLDPSPPMPWWDKSRLLIHGSLLVSVEQMRWTYHISLDPYNTRELIDWRWNKATIHWTNGRWFIKGDLQIVALAESKYNEVELVFIPELRLTLLIDWLCNGSKDNHHEVTPCAPMKVPDFAHLGHDSYRSFRSQGMNLKLKLDCKAKPQSSNRMPDESYSPNEKRAHCLFYSSSIRLLDTWRTCMLSVTRPTKRGSLYKTRPSSKKPTLMRHIRNLGIELHLPEFDIGYWMSHTLSNGFLLTGGRLHLLAQLDLSLVPPPDKPEFKDLKGTKPRRRLQANWSVGELNFQLAGCQVRLRSTSEFELKPQYTELLSVSHVKYKRTSDIEIEHSTQHLKPRHKLDVQDGKLQWTQHNRDVCFSIYEGYWRYRDLNINLASDSLKTFTAHSESQQTTSKSRSSSILGSSNIKPGTGDKFNDLLQHLIADSETRFMVHSEDNEPANVSEQLRGVILCQRTDVVSKHLQVDLTRMQLRLHGVEKEGYILVAANKATITQCNCHNVWYAGEFKSKTTWISSVEGMQYFSSTPSSHHKPVWLSQVNMDTSTNLNKSHEKTDIANFLNSSENGKITRAVVDIVVDNTTTPVQLQRIISRCKCQLFYVNYGDVDMHAIHPEQVTSRNDSQSGSIDCEEGIDTFTLLHHDIDIATSSVQYNQIIDLVNNLVLYSEPTKKQLTAQIEEMRFSLLLSNEKSAQKAPILQLQERLRNLQSDIRQLDRDWYGLNMEIVEGLYDDQETIAEKSREMDEISHNVDCLKEELQAGSHKLSILISCYNQIQLQDLLAERALRKRHKVLESRRSEVCFLCATWRLSDIDGQLDLADVTLRNFMYTKVNYNDDSCSHQLELGWIQVSDKQQGTPFKKVLEVQERRSAADRNSARLSADGSLDAIRPSERLVLRIYCKNKAPVGGIAIHEHFEVNLEAIALHIHYNFYTMIMKFFFPPDETSSLSPPSQPPSLSGSPRLGVRRRESTRSNDSRWAGSRTAQTPRSYPPTPSESRTDIDIMKERASKNQLFCYVKCSQVKLRLSYKGRKDKDIKNITDYSFVSPELEYRNLTSSWKDLITHLKSDIQRELLPQAMSQKLGVKSKFYTVSSQPEGTDEDKTRLLLGDLGSHDGEKKKRSKKGFHSHGK